METSAVVSRVLHWYDGHARDLPWRRLDATPWQIMVSEFMLQQTPVERVRQPWQAWVERWPAPSALAAAPAGEAVRAWGRLGYPRRAVRLHQAAALIARDHADRVPDDAVQLRALPGVGSYTAAAILSFAYRQRQVVLDTNVRRVLARVASGVAHPGAATTAADVALAETFLPRSPARAARWAVASMELGALVCTARLPNCAACPVSTSCGWRRAGYPPESGPPRRRQTYAGTDRQCRGVLLGVLRSTDDPVAEAELAAAWVERQQCQRALASLVDDGLAVRVGEGGYALPG